MGTLVRTTPVPANLGFEEVSRDEFFAYVNPRNIPSAAQGSIDGPYRIYTEFKSGRGPAVGRIMDKHPMNPTCFSDSMYMLRPDLVVIAKTALDIKKALPH
jgi:hypothetical protein